MRSRGVVVLSGSCLVLVFVGCAVHLQSDSVECPPGVITFHQSLG